MSIKRIEVRNFKSFKDLSINLGEFNVVIGANASGKSNFVSIFKFLRDIVTLGLENAVSLQGGVEYLRNINIGYSENLYMKVVFDEKYSMIPFKTRTGIIGLKSYETVYEFSLKFYKIKRKTGFRIEKDRLIYRVKFLSVAEKNGKSVISGEIGEGKIVISQNNRRIRMNLIKPKNIDFDSKEWFIKILDKLPEHTLLIEVPTLIFPPLNPMKNAFALGDIAIYDFDPKLPKKATPITGKAELEEDGSNLSIILKNIISRQDEKRRLFNLIRDLLPFVENLDVEKFADKSLLFKLSESFSKKRYLPASLISDGTINITALIIALFFERKPFVIIEEPERNIHPHLISKLVEMMKDASRHKQILVTTHNPEFVKHAGLENLLLISRNREGFSEITRPVNKEEVKIFLENDIGIDELYVQNLLEV